MEAGPPRWAAPEREMLYRHAARQAATAAEHIRRSAGGHPAAAADTAWAAADAFHSAARALRDPALRRAADAYDRAARPPYGRIPLRHPQRRPAARHRPSPVNDQRRGDTPARRAPLAASLVRLAKAVSELRQAQQHAAQAAAARERPKACTPRSAARGPGPPR